MFAIFIAALLLDPAATLRPDSYDAPAPASVANAARVNAPVVGVGPAILPVPGPARLPAPHKPEVVLYTCPMHPEVTSTKPGTCPKCGMTLVKKGKR